MRRRRGGNAALEFALCLPIWFAIVSAIADFGWLFYRFTTLDAASTEGCRAGSLVDPGDADQNIQAVKVAVENRTKLVLRRFYDDDCASCQVEAWTVGAPPTRTLMCRTTRTFTPVVGMFVHLTSLTTLQISRLEWQREAAPT